MSSRLPFRSWLYRPIRALVDGLCRVLFAVTVEGREHVPEDGAFVLAPVHRSNLDFALVACVTRRRMRFMAKDSLWKVPLLGQLIETLGGYRVNRGAADREALRQLQLAVDPQAQDIAIGQSHWILETEVLHANSAGGQFFEKQPARKRR